MHSQANIVFINSRPYVMQVTREFGQIVAVEGPYQLIGDAFPDDLLIDQGLIQYVKSLWTTVISAIHSHPVIAIDEVPTKIREPLLERLGLPLDTPAWIQPPLPETSTGVTE